MLEEDVKRLENNISIEQKRIAQYKKLVKHEEALCCMINALPKCAAKGETCVQITIINSVPTKDPKGYSKTTRFNLDVNTASLVFLDGLLDVLQEELEQTEHELEAL